MDELLPCPFCGGEAFLEFETEIENEQEVNYFFVRCKQCEAKTVEINSPIYAMKRWNNRKEGD